MVLPARNRHTKGLSVAVTRRGRVCDRSGAVGATPPRRQSTTNVPLRTAHHDRPNAGMTSNPRLPGSWMTCPPRASQRKASGAVTGS